MDEIIIEEVIEEELPVEEAPRVAPLFEVVDPQIPQVAPEPVINHIPDTVTSHITHPWTVPPFNIVDRDQPRIRPILATIKVSLSLAVVFSLMVGYGLRLKIVSFGAYSFGMYGLLLIIDFIVQASAATYNRHRVNRLTKKSPITKGVDMLHARNELPTVAPSALPEVSIAVVGYREDEEAWQACLKSLREQEYPVKHIIGVVDGNDKPDCDMAEAFTAAFPENERTVVHLPVLLSVLYKQKYWETIEALGVAPPTKWQRFRMWFTQEPRAGQDVAHEVAWNHMLNYLHERATAERWADWKALCFTEPHGHKRHAMFTAFVVGAYVLGTKDAMLTTDSDTLVHKKAVTNLMALLFSSPKLAGVTGDVRIWNKKESFLARMSALRYWFAFNVERACQSGFGCVGCLSGPLGLYKVSDMMTILGPWILQSFLGKETTFGDDRHLTNRILSLGHKTGYTHLAVCDSDTPAGYVRWVKQQTRWSKSFFREAFWFPKSFAYHDFWLTVETTKQFLYPMILTATVLQMLYKPGDLIRPAIWLGTMFGVATIKSLYGVIAEGDLYYMLFGAYGFMYFFGLLPSKLFACFTVGITTWGTSARSKSEFTRPESFYSRTTHIGHLVVWYLALTVGLGFFFASRLSTPLFFLIALVGLFPVLHVYSDVIIGETRYAFFMLKKWRQARRSAQDVDENVTSKFRIIRTRRRRVKVPAPKVMDFVEPEKFATPAPFPEENPFADVNIVDPPIFRTSEDSNAASTNSTLASDSTHTAYSASGSNASTASVDVAAPTDGDKDAVITHAGKFGLPALDTVNVPAVLRKDVSGLPVLKKHKSVEETRIESMEDDGKLSDSTSESGYFLSRASSMGDLGADRASIASSQMNSPFLTPLTEFPTRIPGSSKSGKRSFSKLAIMRSRPKETAKTPLAVS
ncbi:nucleotide-diphospho-sugar transferase [Cerioporus squamosus]|nr:nucleotide-diphospho-sugar transferase [Cerioporus squamosus]